MEIHLILLVFLGTILPSEATPEISAVYALEGQSAIFMKQRNIITEFDDISFKFNSSQKIMTFIDPNSTIDKRYKGRLFFNRTIFSLELKNLQKNDSGLYECQIRWNKDTSILKYTLFVLEPVAAPVLTVSKRSDSNSCNVTVTCRGHDLSLTLSCNSSDCTQLGDLPITPTLAVYTRDGYIVCNHSNQVSWHNITLDMSSLCKDERTGVQTESQEEASTLWIPLTIGSTAGIAATVVLLCVCLNKRKSRGRDFVYAAIWRAEAPERPVESSKQ